MSDDNTRVSRRSRSRSPRRRARSRSPIRKGRGGREVRGQECRVYVSNLSYEMKWMELKDVMKKLGTVEHVEIFTDNNGRSKGIAVVEYSNAEDAARAIKELDGNDVCGRKIRLREDKMGNEEYNEQLRTLKEKSKAQKEQQLREQRGAGSGYGRGGGGGGLPPPGVSNPLAGAGGIGSLLGGGHQQLIQLLNSKGGDPINSSVFLSNLDYDTSWQKIKDMLRRAGNCTRCDIAQDEGKRSKGFGSAQFETPFEALTAIAMFNGMELGSQRRKMSVRLDREAALHQVLEQLGVPSNEVTEKTIQQLQSIATLSTLTGAGGLGGLGALGQLSALASASGSLGGSASTLSPALSQLTGLSQLAPALGGLQSLLTGGLGSSLASLANVSAASSQAPGTGYGSTPAASSYSGGLSYYGGSSGVGAGYGNDSNRSSRRDSSGRSGDGGGRSGGGNRDPPAPPGCRVFIRNLPFSLKWQDLKDKLRDAGPVNRVDIKTNDDGRSKGYGTVTFDTPGDAQRAVSQFNGTRIDGREIDMKIDN